MKFQDAVNVLANRQHLNITDEQDAQYNEAATVILNATHLPAAAFDWILEGDFSGNETARSIRKEYNS